MRITPLFVARIKAIGSLVFLPFEYLLDFILALRYSKASPLSCKSSRDYYDIILLAHTIEKGLSQKYPRPGFGKAKIMQLLLLASKASWHGRVLFAIEKSYGALLEYTDWNEANGNDIDDIRPSLQDFFSRCEYYNIQPRGGTKHIDVLYALNAEKPIDFLSRRFSCRIYSPVVVADELICSIFSLAQRAPSQCNRQSTRVHCFRGKMDVLPLLRLQRGAAGFDEDVCNLFVITSDMTAWSGSNARNQAFVDGSLFSMQLSLACAAYGLVSCPLNLAVSNYREYRIKRAAQIPQSERLVMMLSFGYPDLKTTTTVAAFSSRIPAEQVLCMH